MARLVSLKWPRCETCHLPAHETLIDARGHVVGHYCRGHSQAAWDEKQDTEDAPVQEAAVIAHDARTRG